MSVNSSETNNAHQKGDSPPGLSNYIDFAKRGGLLLAEYTYTFVSFILNVINIAAVIAIAGLAIAIYFIVRDLQGPVQKTVDRILSLSKESLPNLIITLIIVVLELVIDILRAAGVFTSAATRKELEQTITAGTGVNEPMQVLIRLRQFRDAGHQLTGVEQREHSAAEVMDILVRHNIWIKWE